MQEEQEGRKKASKLMQSLSEVFHDYGEDVDVPKELESRVFKSLDKIFFAADFIDLFSGKFINSEISYLEGFLEKEKTLKSEKNKK